MNKATENYYARKFLESAETSLIYPFMGNMEDTRSNQEKIMDRIRHKVHELRIWLGEKIAGERFYNDYD